MEERKTKLYYETLTLLVGVAELRSRGEGGLWVVQRKMRRRMLKMTASSFGPQSEVRAPFVGRRVLPETANFNVLPWGFVPQNIVQEQVAPAALKRYQSKSKNMTDQILVQLGQTTADDACEGAIQCYKFIAETFSERQVSFEDDLDEAINPSLGRLYDSQLRQLGESVVEVHSIHDVVLTTCFPLVLMDPTDPEILDKSSPMFDFLGVNHYTARLHFIKEFTQVMTQQFVSDEDHGLRIGAEVLLKTTETVHFGPSEALGRHDAQHVLFFHAGRDINILSAESAPDFALANVNEALSMIQNTATPEEWVYNTS